MKFVFRVFQIVACHYCKEHCICWHTLWQFVIKRLLFPVIWTYKCYREFQCGSVQFARHSYRSAIPESLRAARCCGLLLLLACRHYVLALKENLCARLLSRSRGTELSSHVYCYFGNSVWIATIFVCPCGGIASTFSPTSICSCDFSYTSTLHVYCAQI